MAWLHSLLLAVHVIGLALGVGCATAKLTLLLKSRADQAFLQAYLAVARPITRLIVLGLVLLALSGFGWLLLGYNLKARLVVKLGMVVLIFVLGPIIDNVVEPKFRQFAPGAGESASPAFLRIQRRYLLLEVVATGFFYLIIVMWTLA